MHEQIKNIEDPSQLWLTEMLNYYYGTTTYLEVQFWLRTQEGKMQIIQKCTTHPSLLKLPGQDYDEKTISHEEVKWTRNTVVFGVNFNCTRTCFRSELYMFIRVRCGDLYLESAMTELPFRRSEKRKGEHCVDSKCSKRQVMGGKTVKPKKKILVSCPAPVVMDNIPKNVVEIHIPNLPNMTEVAPSLLDELSIPPPPLDIEETSSTDYVPINLAELINMETWDPDRLIGETFTNNV